MSKAILFVTPYMRTGGTEKVVYALARGLTEKGWTTAIASSGGPLAEKIKGEGVNTFCVAELKSKRPFDLIRAATKVRKIISNYDRVLLNSHSFTAALVCGFANTFSRTCPKHVFTMHIPENVNYYFVMGSCLNFLSDRVVTVCMETSEALRRHGLLRDKTVVIYNGIDTELFDFHPLREWEGKIHIGIVARLVDRKGHKDLFRAAKQLSSRYDLVVHIIGDGPARQSLEALAYKLSLADRIVFWGDRDDVPERLRGLHLFVLPSYYEGFPLTILEAMSAGVPVVASNVNGIPEVISHGHNGLLVRPGDPLSLSKAMAELIESAQRRNKLIVQARRTIEQRFSVRKMVDSYERLFEQLLSLSADRN